MLKQKIRECNDEKKEARATFDSLLVSIIERRDLEASFEFNDELLQKYVAEFYAFELPERKYSEPVFRRVDSRTFLLSVLECRVAKFSENPFFWERVQFVMSIDDTGQCHFTPKSQ